MKKQFAAVVLALGVVGIGCGKKEEPPPPPTAIPPAPTTVPTAAPVAVAGITLGNSIGADKKVAAPLETFGVKDKVYASVETTGQGHAKLRALWSYVKGDKTAKVNETTIEFDATGPASNEFHVENTKPWPKGDYKIEVFLGDGATAAATKSFKVQ